MIKALEFPTKEFATKDDLFKDLIANKSKLISLKKSQEKKADAVSLFYSETGVDKGIVSKADVVIEDLESLTELTVKVVINTTNLLDSHGDVHIDGIWNKALKDNSTFLHLQEHDKSFNNVISDDAKAAVKSMGWADLGLNFEGKTQALIFDSVIQKKRNPFMLSQYANKWVKNHSVGMRYVQMNLAINSEAEWNKEEKEVWDKYYPVIANKEAADQKGYFWAVTEAKIIEGSAVVFGSNFATPTLSEKNQEPSEDTSDKFEPSEDTQTEKKSYYSGLI